MFPTPSGLEFLTTSLIIVCALLIPFILYLITLQNTIKSIAPQNRMIQPGQVWLMFIPVFNVLWEFIMVSRISDSIRAELKMRGTPAFNRPTYGIGLATCILPFCGRIPIPYLSNAASFAAIVCWIIYWVKVNEYKILFQSQPYQPEEENSIFNGLNY